MQSTNLSSFDLNLLLALDALLDEASVTRAARRVGLSQPAMSHALGRLREHLDDPLLVRAGRGMTTTPKGEALREPLRRLLGDLDRLLDEEGDFEPATSTRTFHLTCPDLLAATLPDLLAAMSADAPSVRLDVRSPPGPDLADVALGPAPTEGPDLVVRALGRVSWAVIGRADHPAFRGRLTVAKWTRYPHVQIRTGSAGPGFVDDALAAAGVERTIGLRVPAFLVAPEIVARTDYLFTGVRELVEPIADRLGLALRRPPVPIPDVPVAAMWHARMQADPGHRWFRGRVADVLSEALGRRRRALPR